MKPGIYPKQPMAEYLKLRALSGSVLATGLSRCWAAALHESQFNPEPADEESTKAQNIGTALHSRLLEGHTNNCVVVLPEEHPNEKGGGIPTGWTNKAMKLARDTIIADGKIPMLPWDMNIVAQMYESATEFIVSLKKSEPAIYAMFFPGGGESELTIVWDDNGTPCKMRPDRISNDRTIFVDVKSTAASAEPIGWGRRQLYPMGFDVGAGFYRRGAFKTFGVKPLYLWLVIEQKEPYLCSLVALDPAGEAMADAKAARGVREWQECEESGKFPPYPSRVVYIETPPWEVAQEEAQSGGIPYDVEKLFGGRENAE